MIRVVNLLYQLQVFPGYLIRINFLANGDFCPLLITFAKIWIQTILAMFVCLI